MKLNYYNEINPEAAAWLRELIATGEIAPGEVDERSITDLTYNELSRFNQCHFFAGIGGWSLALRLAGWPDDKPAWTGSCPCQPFSQAGKRKVDSDERHLWPAFRAAIAECKPAIVFGEQVASKDGRIWLAGVRSDLEALGYGVGAADLCAAGIGAPHIRQRLYWVAYAVGMADSGHECGRGWPESGRSPQSAPSNGGGLGHSCGEGSQGAHDHERSSRGVQCEPAESSGGSAVERLGDTNDSAKERQRCVGVPVESKQEARGRSFADAWSNFEVVGCADGKSRRIESGSQPLVYGLSGGVVPSGDLGLSEIQNTKEGRVMRLRGYGNAIVPQLAAEFIQASQEA